MKTSWGISTSLPILKKWLKGHKVPDDCNDEMLKWMIKELDPSTKIGMGENPIGFSDSFKIVLRKKGEPLPFENYRIVIEMDENRIVCDVYLG